MKVSAEHLPMSDTELHKETTSKHNSVLSMHVMVTACWQFSDSCGTHQHRCWLKLFSLTLAGTMAKEAGVCCQTRDALPIAWGT